ncbi:MAG: hypothetical protein ILM98_15655 [Kiritimatiellae bacterium]|nr:hypothetical protein [Kiritimatiellia bacterium]
MKYPIHSLRTIGCAASIAALAAIPARAVNVVGDANAETTISPSNTVIKMTQSGTLTVTEPGEIEILLVGGGGGGGANYVESSKTYYGGGGGAGGVIHKTAFQVTAGEWDVTIGAGGAVGANGGKTTAFGMTAWGGGRGAKGAGLYDALSGASGGGGARYYFNDQNDGRTGYKGAPAKSEYVNDYFNLGNAGSSAANEACLSGHGGGAGGAATWDKPGAAYRCSITGADVAYAGGGGGYAWNVITGVGGGKNSFGGGGNMNNAGGPGVVIVRFTRNVKAEMAFDDAIGGTVTTCRVDGMKYQVHTFAQSGQFSIPHHGHVEVLVVGGGGGGGSGSWPRYGGGGGAGGVVYKSELFITNGVYDIVIGSGGAVGANGGTTTAFGMTAWGGGHGATGGGANAASGASGGGGAGHQDWASTVTANTNGAEANPAYTNAPYCNLGYAGSPAPYAAECSGAGGGAGGPAGAATPNNNGTHRSHPGAAYVCSITGSDVAYAGGGSGRAWNTFYRIAGGGSGSYGGGGDSGGAGGPGVVIVRHQLPKTNATVISFR